MRKKKKTVRYVSLEDYDLPRFLQIAYREALKGNGEHRLGAVLIRRGKPISVGHNRYNKTNKLVRKFFKVPTVHAECDVVHRANGLNLKGTTLYVIRVRARGEIAMSRPCINCMNLIRSKGIRRIIYSIYDPPFFVEEKL